MSDTPPARARVFSRRGPLLLMGALLLPVTVLAASPARTRQHRPLRPAAHPAPDYNRDVRPILAEHCFACHGVDGNQRRAALRLDRREDALAPAASGRPAVRPGNAAASELVRRIRATDARVMPPPSTHRKLSPQQVSTLTRWVEAGAPYAPHWSYLPPRRTPPPPVRAAAWPVNAVDRFVLARLEREGLRPAPDADRATLLRRVSFDLTGLPPTRQELDAFLADRSPGAYERVVDRLLASPHYGERMAVFWLDLARYADTDGYHGDRHRSVYPYRDWVIHAFNSNMPFDQFTAEQLAGDLLPQATVGQRIASTFNRLNMTTREGGAQPREYLAKYASERVRTTSQVWLGTTLGCAECHDHKYDPFTTRDFYRFAAYFADIQQVGLYPNDREDLDPILRLPTPEQDAAWTALESRLAALRARAASEPAEEKALKEQVAALEKERAELDRAVSRTLVTAALPEPMVTRILPRGNWMDESGEVVSPAPPPTLGAPPAAPRRLNRLDLATWLTSPANPLTSRVLANRLWALCFGTGLSRSPGDFGVQGSPPTHPELLDWLALELVDRGWDIKRLLRILVTSRTYRQASAVPAATRLRDPQNLLLARQNRFRLDAEFVRDNALAAAGLLSGKMLGRSVRPYQPDGYWDHCNTFAGKLVYETDRGEDQYRRGVYTYWKRTFLHPSLLAFDAPTREECTVERARSNTPLQALVLLNDPTYVEAARALAARALREGGTGDEERISWAFRTVTARTPLPAERRVLLELLVRHRGALQADPSAAAALLSVGDSPRPPELPPMELAAWTSVARALLNLHEAITRE